MAASFDPLQSAWAKYYWASKHAEKVHRTLKRTLDPSKNPLTLKTESKAIQGNTATVLASVQSLPEITTECCLALGDAIHNYRSALDHLAWGLVKTGSKPTPSYPEGVYFPVFDSWAKFKKKINGYLPGVSNEYREMTRWYQPYRRGDGPTAIRLLNRFSNLDKHRVLIPAFVSQAELHLAITSNCPIVSLEVTPKAPCRLYKGMPVAEIKLWVAGTSETDVKTESKFAVFPSLSRGRPLTETLALIDSTVCEILSEFDEVL